MADSPDPAKSPIAAPTDPELSKPSSAALERTSPLSGSARDVIGQWYMGQRSSSDLGRRDSKQQLPSPTRVGSGRLMQMPVGGEPADRSADMQYITHQMTQFGSSVVRMEVKQDQHRELFEQLLHRCMKEQESIILEGIRIALRDQREWQIEENRRILEAVKQGLPDQHRIHFTQGLQRSRSNITGLTLDRSRATSQQSEVPGLPSRLPTGGSSKRDMSNPVPTAKSVPIDEEDFHGVSAIGKSETAAQAAARQAQATQIKQRHTTMADIVEAVGIPYEQYQRAQRRPVTWLSNQVDGPYFSGVVMGMVIVNSLWIGVQTQILMAGKLDDPGKQEPGWFRFINLFFAAFYCIELALRIVAFRWSFFLSIEWNWNVYDLLVVCFMVLEEAMSSINLGVLRIMRLTRLLRVVRIIRVLRFLTGLRQLMAALSGSATMLTWFLFTIVFFLFLFAILTMQVISTYVHDGVSPSTLTVLSAYFGTLDRTIYSLYLAVTGGIEWKRLVDPLDDITPWCRLVFSCYIFFMVFSLLNLFTGIVVFQTHEVKQRDRDIARHSRELDSQDFENHLRGYFQDWGCVNERGEVSWHDFQKVMSTFDLEAFLNAHDIALPQALHLFVLLDSEGGGTGNVALDQIIFGCGRMRSHSRNADMQLLTEEVGKLKAKVQETSDHINAAIRIVGDLHQKMMVEVVDLRLDMSEKLMSKRPPLASSEASLI